MATQMTVVIHKPAKEESNVERTRVCGIKRSVEIFCCCLKASHRKVYLN